MKRFLTWFLSPGGAFIGLGVLTSVIRLAWRLLSDLETARSLWVDAGGTMPALVSAVSSIWFAPALIVVGFAYTAARWKIDETKRGRAIGQIADKIGWALFSGAAILVVATILFDSFLNSSGASDFAQYVKNQRSERTLSPEQITRIENRFRDAKSPFKIMVFSIDTPEAIAYGRQFMVTLHAANQTVNGKEPSFTGDLGAPLSARLYSPLFRGLLVGVKANADLSESPEAIRFSRTLKDAGFSASYIGWDNLGPEGFNFVIGPK